MDDFKAQVEREVEMVDDFKAQVEREVEKQLLEVGQATETIAKGFCVSVMADYYTHIRWLANYVETIKSIRC